MPITTHLRTVCKSFAILFALASLGACDDKSNDAKRRGPAPPPAATSAAPDVCKNGGGTISDSAIAAFFPRSIAGYCIDPHGDTRLYGSDAKKGIDAICLEAFNGDCEVYKSFGLDRVAILRYVDGAGSPGSVDVVLSKYDSADGAFGMFTKRVVSGGDPAREGAPRPMSVEGAGAQGTGTAYLWKGQIVVELIYTNDQQTPDQLESTAGKLLASLGKAIAGKLPAPGTLPTAAARLPKEHRVPLGIHFEPEDAFDVRGGGAGAQGFYQEGKKRYRILSIVRDDEPQAKDVLTSILKRDGAKRLKDVGDGAARLMVGDPDGPRSEWLVARKGSWIVGVGDEATAAKPGMSASDRDAVNLSREDKLTRLRALLSAK